MDNATDTDTDMVTDMDTDTDTDTDKVANGYGNRFEQSRPTAHYCKCPAAVATKRTGQGRGGQEKQPVFVRLLVRVPSPCANECKKRQQALSLTHRRPLPIPVHVHSSWLGPQ